MGHVQGIDTAADDICGNLCNLCRLREEVKEKKEREWSRQAHSCRSEKYLQLELSLLSLYAGQAQS